MMYQLIIIVLVGIFLSLGIGYWVGKEVGFSKGVSAVSVEKPDYCTVDKSSGNIIVECNELKNMTLDSLCEWVPEELKNKLKIVIIT
ncbi:hypothetical protein GF374_01585 [Candidatus Woesearchaeota archaeon]|nr:hypothetical protein [Candidatus Woesearchaeota archaeon]